MTSPARSCLTALSLASPFFAQPVPSVVSPEVHSNGRITFRQPGARQVLVERSYRVAAGSDERAIPGLSMGEAESLLVGLNRLHRSSYIGAFSAGGMDDQYTTNFPQLRTAARQGIRLLWIACGREDRLITANRNFVKWVRSQGLEVSAIETPGMHTWMVWRQNLIDFAPLLFRDAPSPK
jgi:enterochelin esterase-like enzyme